MSATWDVSSVKVRLASARRNLRHLQDRKDSQSFILRKDIATLLRQQRFWLARAKAHNLLVESKYADLLERLDMHVGSLLEQFNELHSKSLKSLPVLEAAMTIVYAAPSIDSKDLQAVRNLLMNHLGSDFVLSASTNSRNHVSPLIIRALNSPPPSAFEIDACLRDIAVSHGVNWGPEPSRHDIVSSLSEMLNTTSQTLELPTLRTLCRYGIPGKPPWLRTRIWKLYFCLLSTTKSTWSAEMRKQRNNYYDLVRRILEPFSMFEAPAAPLSPLDASLLDVSKQLARIPSNLFVQLEEAPDISCPCPLDFDAPEGTRIPCASNLDLRLAVLRNGQQASELNRPPEICIEEHDSASSIQSIGVPKKPRPTLLSASPLNLPCVHPRHSSALLRILYMHTTLNPGALSPHVPSLLIPLYSVLAQETEPEDAAHSEADTFWLFEALMAEFNEFEDEHIGNTWLRKFGQRVAWADGDFYQFLCARGLDPALPHYSYRWLATLLTHSLPLSSIILVWDVLFSCPERLRDANHRMDHLLDVCTAMLLCARPMLLQLERRNSHPHPLWSGQDITMESEHFTELSDASAEGMSFLQNYSVESVGGIERILQTAADLLHRRRYEESAANKPNLSMLIKETMMRGFSNQTAPSEESEPSEDSSEDEGSHTETLSNLKSPTLTSRIASTVWKGITNQTAMQPPPSPPAPSTPRASPLPEPIHEGSAADGQWSSNAYNSLWGYAEKLKDSNTAATLSKVSTNWKARTLMAAWGKTPKPQSSNTVSPSPNLVESPKQISPNGPNDTYNDDSSPSSRRSSVYSPPPRPTHFRSPRDSYISPGTEKLLSDSMNTSPTNPTPDVGIISKTKASLVAITHSVSPAQKSAPRPLLLSSKALITPNKPSSLLPNSAPTLTGHDWDYVKIRKGLHRDSLSSVSSLSDGMNRPQKGSASERDSDISGTSRRVPLNRKSVSPLAPNYRVQRSKYSPRTSFASAGVGQGFPVYVPRSSLDHSSDSQASPAMSDSPSFTSPVVYNKMTPDNGVLVTKSERQRDSVLSEGPEDHMFVSLSQPKKPLRRKTPSKPELLEDKRESSITKTPSRAVRVRTKRHQTQPTKLRAEDDDRTPEPSDEQLSPDALKVEWPSEDQDTSVTPTTSNFDLSLSQDVPPKPAKFVHKASIEGKVSNDGREVRVRKVSGSQRTRKVSSDAREAARNARDSAAEEGDDEGYDDLLSAYESEGVHFDT